MVRVAPIRLAFNPRTLWFDPRDLDIHNGDDVVVLTARGVEFGHAASDVFEIDEDQVKKLKSPLKPVKRIATPEDVERAGEMERLGREALPIFKEMAAEANEDMHPVSVEYLLEGDKAVFYFEAEERVDFRELVRKLASRFHVRVDMRQIGVRDEARMVGGLGHCGQELCCARLGGEFCPVSIRMAKEQNLFLNPAKISGICGRLLCCLSYEQENYDRFHHNCPRLGKKYQTTQGTMKVLRANMFRNSLSVLNENNEEQELTLEEWQALDPHRPEPHPNNAQPKQAQQPQKAAQGDGLLVVSVTPENVDDPNLFADVLPPDAPLTAGPEVQPQQAQPQAEAAPAENSKSRRRRRRKSQQRQDGAAE